MILDVIAEKIKMWIEAELSGAFSDRHGFYEDKLHLFHATCLPSGRNSAWFHQQPLSCQQFNFKKNL